MVETHTLQAQAGLVVLEVAEVALAGVVHRPHEARDADDHPAEHGLVHAEGQAGAVAVEALVDLVGGAGRGGRGGGGRG
jgi:hypothetical protein